MDETTARGPFVLAAAPEIPFVFEILVFLLAAVVVVPAVRALRISPILGYLVAGIALGPHALAAVRDPEGVMRLAELGVVFLLFSIGLELSVDRLKAMRRYVFGYGLAQIATTAVLIGAGLFVAGLDPYTALLLGLALALSSTAIVTQLMSERRESATRHGRATFAVLLMQDLAVIPILLLVTLLSMRGEDPGAVLLWTALKAVGVVAAIFVMGRFVLRWLYRRVAKTQSPELLMAMTLLAVLATAWGTGMAGFSMALGAFMAGLLLSETEFRHQIEADVAPFKGLLLGLFFMSVGMTVDLRLASEQLLWVALSVAGLMALKAAVAVPLARFFRMSWPEAVRSGLLLAQSGEFLFVVIAEAQQLVPAQTAQFALIVASVSMLMTPVLVLAADRLARLIEHRAAEAELAPDESLRDLEGHVVIAGYGRVGETVARMLDERRIPFVAVDSDAGRTRACREGGAPVYFGDAANAEMLESVGAGRAAMAVVTVNDREIALRTLRTLRSRWPKLPVYARAKDLGHSELLAGGGATVTVPETLEASLQLSGQVLHALGEPQEAVNSLIARVRSANYKSIAGAGEDSGAAPPSAAAARR